jgi:N-acetylmuramoyl-L-alanine amidase
MTQRNLRVWILGLTLIVLTGCGPTSLDKSMSRLDHRPDWKRHSKLDLPRHPAEKHLQGWVIVLDPGHGGQAHKKGFKRGPTGVREAEMNWRVGKLLEKLLTDAGAHVTLTRDGDEFVSLKDRADVANNLARPDGGTGADLFISLHHNASSRESANYSSVWYHGEADWSEPSLDVARYISHQLGAQLRTNVAHTSPLFSDQLMYDGGFGVLRQSNVPSLLCESSFFTNLDEEQRLRDADYNLREAYAIYRGLCEYAYGGRPTQSVPSVQRVGDKLRISTVLDDGLDKDWWGHDRDRTLSSTINITLDGKQLVTQYDSKTKTVLADADWVAGSDGSPRVLSIHHANMFKHHNYPQRYSLISEGGPGGGGAVTPLGPRRAEDKE